MKKLIILIALTSGIINAQVAPVVDQNNCFNQTPYTKTTDPNDNTPYTYSPGSFNSNSSPNGVGKPINFNWVTTLNYALYTTSGLSIPNHQIRSPFFCIGNPPTDGGCTDRNLRIYNDITADFTNYTTNLQRLKAMDVLPEDGWELLKYSFGRAIDPMIATDPGVGIKSPFIWLYNRFTGKSKFFIAVTNLQGNFNGLNSATIKFTVNGDYDIMANAQPFTHILSDFNHINGSNAAMNCDIQAVGDPSPSTPFSYYWLYGEFTTSYDPCVCRQIHPNSQLEFDVTTTSISNLNLTLDGLATATPIYATGGLNSDGKSVNSSAIDDVPIGTALISGAKAVYKGYRDFEEYAKTYKGYFNNIIGTNGTTIPANNPQVLNIITSFAQSIGQGGASMSMQTQIFSNFLNGTNTTGQNPTGPSDPKATSKFIQKLSGLAPLVEDLASLTPYVGAFLALTNFLSNAGSNESATQPLTQPAAPPTSYALSATIKGTINLTGNVTNGGIYLPGVKTNVDFNQVKNEDYPFPIYNNPLGVFNIIDVPKFEYKTIPMTNNGIDLNDPNYNNPSITYLDFNSFASANPISGYPTTNKPFDNVYDYRLSGSIKYALNPSSNLTVRSIDVAYVLEYDSSASIQLKHNGKQFYPTHDLSGTTIINKQIPYYPMSVNDYNEYSPYTTSNYSNYTLNNVFDKLKNEGFEIEYKSDLFNDPLGNNGIDEKLRIRTKYVPIQNIQNINFILIGSQDNKPKVYLKLFCKFSKNNNPNDEPVTFVMTYDITGKLVNAQNIGSGGYGSYNYYFAKDIGFPGAATTKPGDYAHFSGLNVYGAYYSPQYGTQGPVNISSPITGANSTGNVNIANGVSLIPNSATSFLNYAAYTDFNIGDDVTITTNGVGQATGQIATIRAGHDINCGKGFQAIDFGSSPINFYAGNDIKIDDNFILDETNLYANHNIKLQNNLNYNSLYYGYIYNSGIYAKNEIELSVTSPGNDIQIYGESVFSTKDFVPNITAVLNNDLSNTPVTANAASNTDIKTVCELYSINNRLMANATNPKTAGANGVSPIKTTPNFKTLEQNDYKIGIYPNPTTGNLNVNFFTASAKSVMVSIEDVTGKLLLQQNISVEQGYSNNLLDLQSYLNGIYILKITDAKGGIIKTEKVIVNR